MPSVGPITTRAIDASSPEWDGLVCRFPDHTIFHSTAWLKIIEAAHGVKPVCVAAERAGECIAVWPYLEKKKGPFRAIGSPLPGWSTAYMGPLIADEANIAETILSFLNDRSFKRYAYFACRTLVHHHDVDLTRFGFNLLTRFETYWIDLTQKEDDIWSGFKSECRSRVRKAEKAGVEIRRESDGEFLDDFWKMSEETFAKSHIQPTHTREFCEHLWRRLAPIDRVHAVSAFVDGRRAATLVLPFDAHTMYYWGGASYQAFRDVPVNNLLHWQAMKDAKKRGLRCYDFVSSEGGPGRFKKTFGPQPVDMARHWERSPSRLMRLIKDRYQAYLMKRRRVEAAPGDDGKDHAERSR